MGLLEVYGDRYYFYYQAYANSGEVEILVSLDGKTSTRVMGNVSVRGTGGPRYGGFDVGPHGELAILSDEVLFLSRDDGQTWKRVRLDPLLKAN